ncbi:MAG: lipocalin-like domain-containing protein [Pseudobacteriovorax sp.]|nr:lipocalin-like domain-containing protein [Pseudobacteriovorax sp.]
MEKLIGVWRLDSFYEKSKESSDWVKWRGKVHGTLIYTMEGFVSVGWTRYNTQNSDKPQRTTFYTATYEISSGTVRHTVLEAEDHTRFGKTFTRDFEINEGKLVLRGKGYGDNMVKLEWSKKNDPEGSS